MSPKSVKRTPKQKGARNIRRKGSEKIGLTDHRVAAPDHCIALSPRITAQKMPPTMRFASAPKSPRIATMMYARNSYLSVQADPFQS
ncbi:hypothetical protein D3C74_415320 [compost metagenome]